MLALNKTRSNKKEIIGFASVIVAATAIGLAIWYASSTQHNTQPQNQVSPNETEPASQAPQTGPSPSPSSPAAQQPSGQLVMITENEQYKISRYENSDNYVITLYAIVNNPNQYDSYKEQLREYKQNALKYLQNQGINTNQIHIIYDPNEASSL